MRSLAQQSISHARFPAAVAGERGSCAADAIFWDERGKITLLGGIDRAAAGRYYILPSP
jgi:hypothetical protein